MDAAVTDCNDGRAPPGAGPPAASLTRLLAELAASQYWRAHEIERAQTGQLARLVAWAAANTRHYSALDGAARELGTAIDNPARFWRAWGQLPLLTKLDLRTRAQQVNARELPQAHRPLASTLTSGSTGTPVEVRTTPLTRLFWHALTAREHLWQQRDFSARLGVIRFLPAERRDLRGQRASNWGWPVAQLFPSGPASSIHIGLPTADIAGWLLDFDPVYLLASPSIITALMDALPVPPPALRQLRSAFEPLPPELERSMAERWRVAVTDIYSANEVGVIAFRCGEAGHLHVQVESVLVEILDDAAAPCPPGTPGRVVITSLHNLATPLLRYDIGDFGTLGGPCPCGRAAPVLERIQGRVRNLALAPDGRRFWPVSLNRIRSIAPILHAQYVQTARDAIELRVVLARALSAAEHADAMRKVCEALGHDYRVTVMPVAALERGTGGKFEEFISRVTSS